MTARNTFLLPLVFCGLLWTIGDVSAHAADEPMPAGGWKRQLVQWRDWLHEIDPQRGDEALDAEKEAIRQRIRDIRDPRALKPLEAMLGDQQDYLRAVYVDAVAGIGGREAQRLLVQVSVTDRNQTVRRAAAEWVGKMENPQDALPRYVKYLGSTRYSPTAAEALSISRLAQPLSMVEEPDPALTNALINALVLAKTAAAPWHYWSNFAGGWTDGSSRTTIQGGKRGTVMVPIVVPAPNPQVLKTLTEYTGEDYGYDQQTWKRWYRERKSRIRREN